MKKILLFTAIFIHCYSSVWAQDHLGGNYFSESGIILKIEDSKFKLIMPNSAANGRYSEVMAEGIVKQINASFIELNSDEDIISETIRSTEIKQRIDSVSTDSIKIRFFIPYKMNKLKVYVYTNNFKTFKLSYSDENNELSIPNDIKSFSFYVTPDEIRAHALDGLFHGIVSFDSVIEYKIKDHVNIIEVAIPRIDNSFFEQYYIKGDYARIMNDSIIWKGETYIKSK